MSILRMCDLVFFTRRMIVRKYSAIPLYEAFNEGLRQAGIPVETGIFGADMKCHLVNDGPVTIIIDSQNK